MAKPRRHPDEARALALLSVAYGYVPSVTVIHKFHAAVRSYNAGDLATAKMHLALTGLPALRRMEQVQKMQAAEQWLAQGNTILSLLKHCGIEEVLDDPNAYALYKTVSKSNPYHRGTGPGSLRADGECCLPRRVDCQPREPVRGGATGDGLPNG